MISPRASPLSGRRIKERTLNVVDRVRGRWLLARLRHPHGIFAYTHCCANAYSPYSFALRQRSIPALTIPSSRPPSNFSTGRFIHNCRETSGDSREGIST